ncbi:MAG: CehA/McbA family metallohydrolase, partial [bacterium]|nr:CehA/McbA family metallohydrolase [bacterium]
SPEGSAVHYNKQRGGVTEIHTTLSAHPFTAELPAGEYRIRAEHGKEWIPATETVRLDKGPVRVRLKLRRWIDMAAQGWYSGDTHTHRTLEELPNVVLAEDLNVAFPLLYWERAAFRPPSAESDDVPEQTIRVDNTHLIWPRNTEYEIFTVNGERHTLGAFFVLGHRSKFESGVPPVGAVAKRAREEGGLLELDKHSWPWSMAIIPVMDVDLYELANNHMWPAGFGFPGWGEAPAEYMSIDRDEGGLTEWGWIDYTFQNYYALLNCDFRLRPTAGTASGVHPVPLGFGRVYVRVNGELTVESWLGSLNEGHSFVTTGPMLFVEAAEPRSLRYRVESATPIERVEVIVNGEVAERATTQNLRTEGRYALKRNGSAWAAVRVIQKLSRGRVRFAHSSPLFFDVEGQPLRPKLHEVEYLIRRVREEMDRGKHLLPAEAMAEYQAALAAYQRLLPD